MTEPQQAEVVWQEALDAIAAWGRGERTDAGLAEMVARLPDLRGRLAPQLETLRKLARRKEGLRILSLVGERPHGTEHTQRALIRFAAVQAGVTLPWVSDSPGEALRDLFARPEASASTDAARDRSMLLAWTATVVAPAPDALAVLRDQLRLRDRGQWLPAAVVVADAMSDERASHLAALGLEKACAARSAGAGGYTPRHTAVLGARTARATGAAFAGRTAEAWIAEKRDRNADDLSAIALAAVWLAELRPERAEACGQLARAALARALRDFPRTELGYQHGDAARALITHFGDCDEAWAVLGRPLLASSPDKASAFLEHAGEQLHDLHRTLLWLEARKAGGADVASRIAELREGPLACARSVVVATAFHLDQGGAAGSAETWLPAMTAALAQLAPTIWEASPPLARAASLVSALILVQVPFAADNAWTAVVEAAGAGWIEPSAGTTGARGWVDLAGLAASRGAIYRYLMHRADLDHPRTGAGGGLETIGLARLLRARWRVRSERPGPPRVHMGLTLNCAQQIARRLATAAPAETARVVLAALAADAPPPAWTRLVSQRGLDERDRDNLWRKVRDFLPMSLDRGPIGDVLGQLSALEAAREPETRHAEADGYLAVIGRYPELAEVRATTDAVWRQIVAARAGLPSDVQGGPQAVSPDMMRAWLEGQLLPVAHRLADAARAIEAALGEHLPDRAQRDADLSAIAVAAHDELVSLAIPLLEPAVAERWVRASSALRRLAEPLPWCIEGQLDALLSEFDAWTSLASRHAEARGLLLERIEAAIEDEDEGQLSRILQDAEASLDAAAGVGPRHIDLIDPPRLRAISNFWLRRLRFDQNARIPKPHRGSPWTYYGPLLLAVLGAPLTTVQTNYIWQPIIGDPLSREDLPSGAGTEIRFWAIMLLFFGICLNGLWQDLRRRLGGLRPMAIVQRACKPFAVLLAINYALSYLLYLVSAERLDVWRTTFLWGTLSLYLGIFLGLFAQGARIDREDVDG